jgi:putative ABC transport system substrate-binding protein
LAGVAQPTGRIARIGLISLGDTGPSRDALLRALAELGYVEGRNIEIEQRSAAGQPERLAGLAGELVRAKVDIIVASATPSVQAAMTATKSIPIVMATAGDALGTRLVDNLARPRGNVTGFSLALIELAGKTVSLLREAVPHLKSIACVVHRQDPLHRGYLREVEATSKRIGLEFRPLVVSTTAELDGAMATVGRGSTTGVIFQPIFLVDATARAAIVRLALEYGLPSVSGLRRFAEAGGFVAYSSEFDDLPRRVAGYIDKILKGARPGDLPVEQPTRFELIINLKTARALGLTVAPSVLSRADNVIE